MNSALFQYVSRRFLCNDPNCVPAIESIEHLPAVERIGQHLEDGPRLRVALVHLPEQGGPAAIRAVVAVVQ